LKLPSVAKDTGDNRKDFFNADVQILGMVHEKISGTYDHYLFSENNDHGFEALSTFTSGSTPSSTPTGGSWASISTTTNPNGGFFGLKVGGGITTSTLTGRLVPPYSSLVGPTSVTNPSIPSYMYAETSAPVAFGDNLWMRSPTLNMSVGDYIWVVYGVDAVAAESLTISIE
jgi:hypothetical protein